MANSYREVLITCSRDGDIDLPFVAKDLRQRGYSDKTILAVVEKFIEQPDLYQAFILEEDDD